MEETDGLRKRFNRLQLEAARVITEDRRLTTAARVVGQRLNNMVNFERRYAWPKQETLIAELGIPKRTLIRAVAQLIECGYLRRWRVGRKNRYVPGWLARMGDGVSRAVLAAADPVSAQPAPSKSTGCAEKGANLAPVETPAVMTGPIGASLAPLSPSKGATVAPLESQFEDSYGAQVAAGACGEPAAAGGETAAAGQRELPLMRNIPENPHAAENVAHDRLDKAFRKELGADYGPMLNWLSQDLLDQALAAEIAKPRAGGSMIVNAWRARDANKVRESRSAVSVVGGTATVSKRAHGDS